MSPERPAKVFISYSHDSPEHEQSVLNLANRLRGDGIDAAIDQYETSPREGWPVWMEKQIRESDFVLVVCTPIYLGRAERREKEGVGKGAIWESALTLQYLYNASANNERFIPVVFSRENIQDIPIALQSATYYLVNDDSGYQHLTNRLRQRPEVERPAVGTAAASAKPAKKTPAPVTAKHWNVPHAQNEAFTGREEILTGLHDDLKKRGKQALSGLGGVGKTQIAVEYAYRQRDEYAAVLWTFADTEQSVRGGFARMADMLDLPEKDATEHAKVTDAVKRWLEQNEGWLLVLDNADDPGMVKRFLPQQGKGHILLTSRAHTFQTLGILSHREVNVLAPGEAREFLLRRTGKDPSAKSPEADALAKELGYLPLALEQAAAYVVETGAGFGSYFGSFKKQGLNLLEKQGPVLGNDEKEQQKRTVATTWAVNFVDVEKNSLASAELLRLSAFLAPDAIPLELLEKGAEELPKSLAAKVAEAGDNPLALDELLSPLLRYSLVRRNDEKRTYSIHPLVQEVVREGLSKKEQKTWAEKAVGAVNAAFPDIRKFENWPAGDRFLSHALSCAEYVNLLRLASEEAALLLNRAGYYLDDRAEYVQAELLYRQSIVIRKKVSGLEHPETATTLNNLAELYRKQYRYAEAEPLFRETLEICEKALGPEHPHTAGCLNNLALQYRAQGQYKEAEPLFRRALAIFEKILGPEHPYTATSLNSLAGLYCDQGQYKDAEPLLHRALAIDEKTLGPNHPDTAIVLNNLAGLHVKQGQYETAESLYRRSLAIYEDALGQHPYTALSLNNLAQLYDDQGKLKEAEPLYERALEVLEKMLGVEHPNTITVRNNLIGLYRQQSRHAEADALAKSAKGKAE